MNIIGTINNNDANAPRVNLFADPDGGRVWAGADGETPYQTDVLPRDVVTAWAGDAWGLELRTPDIDATATAGEPGEWDDWGGSCSSIYSASLVLEIDGARHDLGAVGGWVMGGWIAPGASSDLDGSGLANWGSSQHGGWSEVDSDGATSGRPSVAHDDDTVIVHGGEGAGSLAVELSSIPAYAAAVTLRDGYTNERGEASGAYDIADVAVDALGEAIFDAIESALESMASPAVGEPDAADVWADIDAIDATDSIRLGDWRGAGPVVVARNKAGECYMQPHPDAGDAERAAAHVADDISAEIAGEIVAGVARILDID